MGAAPAAWRANATARWLISASRPARGEPARRSGEALKVLVRMMFAPAAMKSWCS